MDNEIYCTDRQVLAAIANALKEISATLKEIARKEA